MSILHFCELQWMIDQLEICGYKDCTEQVKPYYQGEYQYLCTFDRPFAEQDAGPIYCQTVKDLVELYRSVIVQKEVKKEKE